jgi:hypothetical protein
MNMNHHEEVPDSLGGLGETLPADVLKKVNELLNQLHQTGYDRHCSHIEIVLVSPGAQHVGTVNNQYFHTAPGPAPNRGGELPEVLGTEEAMALWRKAQQAGYVDEHYQPQLSRTQAALLADAMAERLGIKEKWKVFEGLWGRNNMRGDYARAMNQRQSLSFQDKLKRLFSTDNEENTGKT